MATNPAPPPDVDTSSPALSDRRDDQPTLSRGELGLAQDYVAPLTRTHELLAEMWRLILRIDQVGVEDDFFALGGDSLKAAALFAAIEARFKKKLPLAVLAKGATVAFLASQLDNAPSAPSSSILVPIKPSGTKTPLFLVHGMHGHVFFANFVARHLPDDQPLHALQARGLESDEPPHASIEEMARDYVAALRTVQPRGPYVIAGYCAGSLVALEMARQLAALGDATAVLFMLDPPLPPSSGYVKDTIRLASLPKAAAERVVKLHRASIRELAQVWKDTRFDGADPAVLDRATRVSVAITQAYFAYQPQPSPEKVIFICSEDMAREAKQDTTRFWNKLARRGLMYRLTCSHAGLFTRAGDAVVRIMLDELAKLPAAGSGDDPPGVAPIVPRSGD